ncbi:MAG: aspartate/glutamate racemase family protein, partial [Solobacterium sp.]|nr:aspartate/glutamate racemase family protein [Solobacterium sp.]
VNVIRKLQAKGAEGVILGCTEIPMLIKQKDSPVPVFDTTELHALSAVDYALGE